MKRKSSLAGFFGASAILVVAAGFCAIMWLSPATHTEDTTGNFNMTAVVSDPVPDAGDDSVPTPQP